MGDAGLVAVALAIAVGLVGIVVPVLPGTVLIAAATLVWALFEGGQAWLWFSAAVVLMAAGQVAMYLLPGRRMTRAGIRRTTLLLGALLGVVGFFVIPVVGLPIGFVLGVFLGELLGVSKVGNRASAAWRSTVVALKNVGLSVAIEAGAALLATVVWVAGALSLR
ncbi:DUF456 domain-containing protein [Kineococcus sp. SYSU DK003]|uniref:DUF456 domain-containing protein n=1 Tax=Kineococcus sp. SYSU DK003 TaxID=3383124 RepID=UPI003D7D7DD0